jgi:peptidyl-prolyl cis-trans isomerase D
MKWFRERRRPIFIVLAVVVVLGSFVGFGGYFMTESTLSAAATVNGRSIPAHRLEALVQQVVEDRRRQGVSLSDADRQTLKRMALERLVQESVFLDEADRLGLKVSDGELASFLQSIPGFQENGRFNPNYYLRALANMRTTADRFEDDLRRELLVRQVQFLMASPVKVTNAEFNDAFQRKLLESKPDERKSLQDNPAAFRDQLRRREIEAVLTDWYTQINAQLKIKIMSKQWETPATHP